MNKFLFILLSGLTMCANSAQKDELNYESVRRPAVLAATRLGRVDITHNGKYFAVIKDGKAHPVEPYLVDKTLRDKSSEQVARYLAYHAIEIKEVSGQGFSLQAYTRTLGGGPLTANFLYWGTKTFCYGTAVAAVGTAATEAVVGGAGITGAMVAIESASLAMGAVGAACWFLP